jgi:hypothetical protein
LAKLHVIGPMASDNENRSFVKGFGTEHFWTWIWLRGKFSHLSGCSRDLEGFIPYQGICGINGCGSQMLFGEATARRSVSVDLNVLPRWYDWPWGLALPNVLVQSLPRGRHIRGEALVCQGVRRASLWATSDSYSYFGVDSTLERGVSVG